jgi:hypothetical protein
LYVYRNGIVTGLTPTGLWLEGMDTSTVMR